MAARKPEIKFPVDEIAKAIAKVLKQSSKPSRSSVKNTVRSDVRRGQYYTMRNDPSTKGMSDSAIMSNLAKSKPTVSRKTVKNIRSTYKGGR
jgi:hypothetical protein